MLKLKKLKAEADAKKAMESEAAAAGKAVQAKTSAGELVLQKGALTRPGLSHALAPSPPLSQSALRPCQPAAEIGDLKHVESDQIIIDFPDPDNLMSSEVTIKPSTSLPRLRLRPRVIPLDRWLIAPARLLASPRRAVDGYWAGGAFKFTMNMPKSYPHDAPKVHCTTKVRARPRASALASHARSHHTPAPTNTAAAPLPGLPSEHRPAGQSVP